MRSKQTGWRVVQGILALAASLAFANAATAQAISAEDAKVIAQEAYLYFYPLVSMDLTRRKMANIEPGKGFGGPMNSVVNITTYPPAEFKDVVRPNFDTLYSSIWIDLTKDAQILSVPDTGGRFYLMPMLDMWSDVFASPGSRTTGTKAGQFLITPPGWSGTVPAGVTRIESPTRYVWIIGRTRTDGPADYDAVHKIQAGYRLTALADYGKAPRTIKYVFDPSFDMKTPPKQQVDAMDAVTYFTYAAELMKLQAPHVTDQPVLARMKRIGIEPGKSFDFAGVSPLVQQALLAAPKSAQLQMAQKLPTLARVVNGWTMNTDTMGVYGNYYLKRAIIAQFGLGANLPEDAIYPANLADASGRALDGANQYVLHFAKGALPPVDAFWSVTLYDVDGFQIANPLNRFALSSWMPFRVNDDGSLDLYFQHDSPGKDWENNWLPAPAGPFNVTMRLYGPRPEVLVGGWNPPSVQKTAGRAELSAQ